MEYYGKTLCISHEELTDGITTASTIKNWCRRNQVVQVRRACYGSCALYEVESLPVRYRAEVYRRHPDLRERAESKPFVETIEMDGRALQFYADYVLSDGRHLSFEKQMEYANNCAIMNAFGRLIDEANSQRIRQSKPKVKKTEFWKKAAGALPRIADKWPHSLPESPRKLQDKYRKYMTDGFVCFISGKFANSNAAKVDDEAKEALLLSLIAHHNNLDNVQVAGIYNLKARKMGWKEITASAVGVWRDKRDLLTASGRLGATNFRNTKSMQVKRSRPTAAFHMWTLDGWDCELLYQTTTTDKKGHRTTTYSNRLTLEVVLDPCCDYPIGFAIGTHETPELIKEALRDAARHSQELFGEMLRANQLQCDHYAIKAMTPLYGVMSDKVTPARVKNSKSKVVEPYFGYLNKTYCKLMNNWSGYGITTDPKRQPNSEALNMLRHSFPDEAGVREQITQIIMLDRARKIEKFRECYTHLAAERRLPLTKENYLYWFGRETGNKNALEGSGLRPTLLGEKRDYDCFDIRFRQHAGVRWTVKYDPDDMSEVLAVNDDGTLRFMLQEKYVQPMALADRKEGDAERLAEVRRFNEQLEGHIMDNMALNYQRTEVLIEEDDNLLKRLLICDSRGQHKLPKARKRLKIEDAEVVEVEGLAMERRGTGRQREENDDYSIF